MRLIKEDRSNNLYEKVSLLSRNYFLKLFQHYNSMVFIKRRERKVCLILYEKFLKSNK